MQIPRSVLEQLAIEWEADLAALHKLRTAIKARLDATANGTEPEVADAQLAIVLADTANRHGKHYET